MNTIEPEIIEPKTQSKNQSSKFGLLALSILFDAVGMLSFAIPGIGEFSDVIWAPISALLVYKMSNLEMRIPLELVDKFKKGTVPNGTASDEELKMVSGFLFSTIERSKEDYENGIFQEFNAYTTSANVTLKHVHDAIAFNLFHEGLHLGVILSLQKALLN